MSSNLKRPYPGDPGYLEFLRQGLYNRFVFMNGRPMRRNAQPLMDLVNLEREEAFHEALDAIENPTPAMKQRIAAVKAKGPRRVKCK